MWCLVLVLGGILFCLVGMVLVFFLFSFCVLCFRMVIMDVCFGCWVCVLGYWFYGWV